MENLVQFIYANVVGGESYNDKTKPWKKFMLLRFPFFNYIAYELHKNAKYALEQSGAYQDLYRLEMK